MCLLGGVKLRVANANANIRAVVDVILYNNNHFSAGLRGLTTTSNVVQPNEDRVGNFYLFMNNYYISNNRIRLIYLCILFTAH